jgi:CRISPR/Cas system-associated endonuclease Cas1
MKKFIGQLEGRFQQKVLYTPTGKQLSYRDVFLEQVRLLVRHLKGESPYESFTVR